MIYLWRQLLFLASSHFDFGTVFSEGNVTKTNKKKGNNNQFVLNQEGALVERRHSARRLVFVMDLCWNNPPETYSVIKIKYSSGFISEHQTILRSFRGRTHRTQHVKEAEIIFWFSITCIHSMTVLPLEAACHRPIYPF